MESEYEILKGSEWMPIKWEEIKAGDIVRRLDRTEPWNVLERRSFYGVDCLMIAGCSSSG